MRPSIYWIDIGAAGRLGIMARPRSGDWLEDEIHGWQIEGVDTVVSLLEQDEIDDLGLSDEPLLCRVQAIEFIRFPIPDRGLPTSLDGAATLAETLARKINEGQKVAIHCRAGIGRSSTIAACVMLRLGYNADAAFRLIESVRGVAVPDTDEQRAWVTALESD